MGRFTNVLTPLVIPNGGTTSNVLSGIEDCAAFTIVAPAALTAAVTLQVSVDGTNFFSTTSPAVTLAASSVTYYVNQGIKAIKLLSAGAEGAARTFVVGAQVMP